MMNLFVVHPQQYNERYAMPDSKTATAALRDSTGKPVRHVMGISGGKDSSALAIYMRGKVPEMEYFFCDTGSELPETYEYLQRLEDGTRQADRATQLRAWVRPLAVGLPGSSPEPADALVHQGDED